MQQLGADAGDDQPAVPIGHPIDPDDEPAGREPGEVVGALDQHLGGLGGVLGTRGQWAEVDLERGQWG